MSGLDAKYYVTTALQEVFVNPTTGEPIANGTLEFYKDNARSVAKHVWQLSGSPPGYTYTDLGVIVNLSAGGVPIDALGNEIRIYYRPYDTDGNLELYYVKVKDSVGVQVFDIAAHPNIASSTVDVVDNVTNYIENGSFNLSNTNLIPDIPIDASGFTSGAPLYLYGHGTPINIFQNDGYWDFYKTNTTATDSVTLVTLPTSINYVAKYGIRFQCTVAGSSELTKAFNFVAAEARQFETLTMTVSIKASSVNPASITLRWGQYFGAGGDPSVETTIGSVTLTTIPTKYSFTFIVPTTAGKIFGTGNNDAWYLKIEMPLNAPCDITFTEVQLNEGNIVYPFQVETFGQSDEKFKSNWLPFPQPNPALSYNARDYILTVPTYSFSVVSSLGSYTMMKAAPLCSTIYSYINNPGYYGSFGYLPCDGQPIPKAYYSACFALMGNMYGFWDDATAVVSAPVTVVITNVYNGLTTDAVDHSTGFTITVAQHGTAVLPQITNVVCTAGSAITNGSYFDFYARYSAGVAGNHIYRAVIVKDYIHKFPSGGAIYGWVPIYINSSDTAATVATKVAAAFNPLSFTLPDSRGMFPRIMDNGAGRDPDRLSRAARLDGTAGDAVGTTQTDQYRSHNHNHRHTVLTGQGASAGAGGGDWDDGYALITRYTQYDATNSGGNETRPLNYYLIEYIKVI